VSESASLVGFSLTDGLPWIERDFLEELNRAEQEGYPEIVRLGREALCVAR